jgi:hypothetical protein
MFGERFLPMALVEPGLPGVVVEEPAANFTGRILSVVSGAFGGLPLPERPAAKPEVTTEARPVQPVNLLSPVIRQLTPGLGPEAEEAEEVLVDITDRR